MTRPYLNVLATIHSWCRARERAAILDGQSRSFYVLPILLQQPSATISNHGEDDVRFPVEHSQSR